MGTQFMSMKNSLFIFFDIYGTLAGFYPEREKIQTKILIKYNITLTENQITEGYKEADEFMTYQKKIKPLRLMDKKEIKNFFSIYEMKILEKNGIFIDKEKAWKIWEEISNEKYELKIFSDVYDNEDMYPYLEKVFDSNEQGFKKFHVKVFEINYEKFQKYILNQ